MAKRELIGWKLCLVNDGVNDYRRAIVKLKILGRYLEPYYEQMLYDKVCGRNTGKKCRTTRAKVLAIYGFCRPIPKNSKVISIYPNDKIEYKVGKVVRPKQPFSNKNVACASGIHFFWSRKAAENY